MSSLWHRVKSSAEGQHSVRLQYMSDLHLEAFDLYDKFDIPRAAPYLILAGDVGRFSSYEKMLSFFQRQCNIFDRVYYVLGNHEFYGLDPRQCVDLADKLENEEILNGKLSLLNQTRIDLNEHVTLLGCTLFSQISEDVKSIVQDKVNDFKGYINDWSIDKHNLEYKRETLWLQQQVEAISQEQPRRKIVVVTHYAPSLNGTAEPKHQNNPWSSAFATNLISDQVMSWHGHDQITHWIFGHTHYCCELLHSNIKLLSNQHGYFPQGSKPTGSTTFQFLKMFNKRKPQPSNQFDVTKFVAVN